MGRSGVWKHEGGRMQSFDTFVDGTCGMRTTHPQRIWWVWCFSTHCWHFYPLFCLLFKILLYILVFFHDGAMATESSPDLFVFSWWQIYAFGCWDVRLMYERLAMGIQSFPTSMANMGIWLRFPFEISNLIVMKVPVGRYRWSCCNNWRTRVTCLRIWALPFLVCLLFNWIMSHLKYYGQLFLNSHSSLQKNGEKRKNLVHFTILWHCILVKKSLMFWIINYYPDMIIFYQFSILLFMFLG